MSQRRHAKPDDRPHQPGTHRASAQELAVRNRVARAEAAKLAVKHFTALPSVPSTTWVNVGPTDAPQEFNYFSIAGVDSGRPNNIVVDPRDPNIVYMAVSGGGVWKTFDFQSASPHWAPTTDLQPNLAVGALALDPDHPDTLFVGNGDFVDASGDTVLKSTDGGGTWAAPVVLEGTNSAGFMAHAGSVRQIGVKGSLVLAATDVGLFASNDGGTTFSLVDLPNSGGGVLAESVWSVAQVGGGAWVAAGVTACAPGAPPPFVYGGSDPGNGCTAGNNVALWHSTDGMTWTQATKPASTGTGRTTLAVGGTGDPAHTRVYAFVGSVDGSKTLGFWRSDDGGQTYVDASGSLANPTLASNQDTSCTDLNVGHDQTWYNQAIVVDPTNADHVLVGGNLCGMRTLNGTAASPTWELVSHWLPGPGYGETANGRLSYVHADWHTATSVVINGKVTTFAGTDGGLFQSDNLFDTATSAESVVWTHHNKGLATHLLYSVASGDPTAGDPFVAFMGLQDNGTRFRSDAHNPSAFNQPVGGDGIGATVHHSASGTTYWGSVEFSRVFCKPALVDCSVESPMAMTDAESHWHGVPSPLGPDEEERIEEHRLRDQWITHENAEPFFEHYSDVETDTTGDSVLTHTDKQVFVATPDGNGGYTLTAISQDLTAVPGGGISNVTASRAIAGLYGAAGGASLMPFFVTTQGNTMTSWTAAQPVHPVAGSNARLTGPASIDFPPVTPAGKQPGDVFIGAFTGVLNDGSGPPPDNVGRLWRTTDHGQTWTSIVGSDSAHQLPNVPVYVVKYDPVTPTTIYAGTDLGVYISTDDAATWNRMGDNFPMISVRDLYVAKNQDFIRAATYGRGLWEIYPSAAESHGAPGNGDYDRNLKIDWVDLGAMSARLGETPANTTPPYYSWILDITPGGDPPVSSIDNTDLNALLGTFGGHP
ncbi:MAG: hypothetical protein JO257_03280 [Deltaproteobacteria bacterium]|nr:hypothetical protein [Deltaproteobacteria bacterium]